MTTKMVLGVEHLSCKERLRMLGLIVKLEEVCEETLLQPFKGGL